MRKFTPAYSKRSKNLKSICLLATAVLATNVIQAQTSCSGNQATNELGPDGKAMFVREGSLFEVNISGISSLTQQQQNDIIAGLQSWAGTDLIEIQVGPYPATASTTLNIVLDSTINSVGEGVAFLGANQYNGLAPDQITNGTIKFNLGYKFACSTGTCLVYDPNAPNADKFLQSLAAHEMGHVMGLYEPPDTQANGACAQTSTSVMGGNCGTNNNGDGMSPPAPTSITPTPCDQQNVINTYRASGIAPHGGRNGGGGSSGGSGSGNGGGAIGCYGVEEWNDSTNTLTYYVICG